MVPENVFGKLRERLLVLEAMFLKVPSILGRQDDAMLSALLHVFAGCQSNLGKTYCNVVWEGLVELALKQTSPAYAGRGHGGRDKGRGRGKGGDAGHGGPGMASPELEPADDHGAPQGVDDPAPEEIAHEMTLPWPRQMACAIARIGWSVQSQLLGGKLLSYYTEWCEAQYPHAMGVAYQDAVILYDQNNTPVTFVEDDKESALPR